MLDTSTRLLRLLSVLQSRRYWAGPELADRLEITPRTLRRDIDRLRSLGYTIAATAGPGGGYQLSQGSALPPLLLEDDEAVAIAVALRSAVDAFTGM
ncbi:MAG TPA: HTH domain-containing protein, partial [bacterium]